VSVVLFYVVCCVLCFVCCVLCCVLCVVLCVVLCCVLCCVLCVVCCVVCCVLCVVCVVCVVLCVVLCVVSCVVCCVRLLGMSFCSIAPLHRALAPFAVCCLWLDFGTVFGDRLMGQGVWTWEIALDSFPLINEYNVVVGLVPAELPEWKEDLAASFIRGGHYFYANTGKKQHSPVNDGNFHFDTQGVPFGQRCREGDVLRLTLDCSLRSLRLHINGVDQGIMHASIELPVRAVVSLAAKQAVSLSIPA